MGPGPLRSCNMHTSEESNKEPFSAQKGPKSTSLVYMHSSEGSRREPERVQSLSQWGLNGPKSISLARTSIFAGVLEPPSLEYRQLRQDLHLFSEPQGLGQGP